MKVDNLDELSKILSDQLNRLNNENRTDEQRAKDIQIAAQVKGIAACVVQNEALKHAIKSTPLPKEKPHATVPPPKSPELAIPKAKPQGLGQITPRAQMRRHNER